MFATSNTRSEQTIIAVTRTGYKAQPVIYPMLIIAGWPGISRCGECVATEPIATHVWLGQFCVDLTLLW
jgi:hypothetical protein